MRKLTPKQLLFAELYIELGSKTEAYKIAYSTAKMKPKTVNRKAVELFENGNITATINNLQEKLEDKYLYKIEQSIERDLKLIKRYEDALEVIASEESAPESLETAKLVIKAVGSNGYDSCQNRLAKMLGFFEKNNNQKGDKHATVILLPDNGRNKGRKTITKL